MKSGSTIRSPPERCPANLLDGDRTMAAHYQGRGCGNCREQSSHSAKLLPRREPRNFSDCGHVQRWRPLKKLISSSFFLQPPDDAKHIR